MQFSKLRLTGFKSFVDPTELLIADGLTGVVGPNGCGKSNLLEALRWVMGENRPTAMRGGGMEDVIFAGASSRPARNYAEVALFIDNKDRLAPPGFNDADWLEVIRRITRDAGSAYKSNGKDVRARDVQMLFADASTGAHSPALVRQGQISELINAKPKARRRVLEEAAGISGLYQRRHDAELKLKGAETNLLRVEDVIEQLDNQLGTLAKQAKQAKRYREIGTELRRAEGLLLYRRWREADVTRETAEAELREALKVTADAQGRATAAARARDQAEAKVPPLREELAIAEAVLQRMTIERESISDQEKRAEEIIEQLGARIDQLGKDIERETTLNADAEETIKRLGWEQDQIEKASHGEEATLSAAQEEARSTAVLMQEQEAELDRENEDVARLAARHQSAHRMVEDAQNLMAKREEDADKAQETEKVATIALSEAETRLSQAVKTRSLAQEAALKAENDLVASEAARASAQAVEGEVRAALSEAEGEANTIGAEVAALERLLARETSAQGQLLDQVRAERGYEAALGAALADELKAPISRDANASGWSGLTEYSNPPALPPGVTPLRDHVSAPDLLDRRLGQIGLCAANDGPVLQDQLLPGQRLVSTDGDLWRWDGYVTRAADASSTSALRLQQANRLDELRSGLAAAQSRLQMVQASFDEATAALRAANAADQEARSERKAADERLTEATRQQSRAESDRDQCDGKLETARLNAARLSEDVDLAKAALKEAQAAVSALGDLDAARAAVETRKIAVETARVTMLTKRSNFDDLRREKDARTKRRQEIKQEVSGWQNRLDNATKRIAELETRRDASSQELKEAKAKPAELAKRREEMAGAIAGAEARRAKAGDSVASAEIVLREADEAARDAERKASEAREAKARAEAVSDAAKEQVASAAVRIVEELQVTPEKLLDTLEADPDQMPPAQKIEEDVNRLRRQRDALGAVNLRAEEDAREVTEEKDRLGGEKSELEEAIAKLRSGIQSLNKEGRQRLLDAFEEVNKNFSQLFTSLFGGGEANLVLVESDDPLEAGLEIMCQPPGKKLSTLSLLSGGEQTLTALALIFAVFLANPAPICVLDEVDAPLDDANVNRFCDLLNEMTDRTDTRFLIITHHAITMARMDRLFGVTMQEQGVSQLVSVDLDAAEKMVA
ncbi:MAG: chromosome segregation protein SMC [Pseudomonadota bacterium]